MNFSEMIISTANAQAVDTGAAASPNSGFGSFIPLILIFVIFYFLLIRPQQKKIKQHQEMTKSLKRGDKVVTAGGIIGTVSKVNSDDSTLQVEIAQGVEVNVMKATISDIFVRPQAAVKQDNEVQEENKNSKKNKNK